MTRRRVAVVGSGIAGLGAAWRLAAHCDVTLFEADARLGGHAHTVDVCLPLEADARHRGESVSHGVDTGFLVFNRRTYPRLVALFESLGVETAASDMSFSVQGPRAGGGRLEWAGTNLDSVFAQRANLLRPRFYGMLADVARFNRLATALAEGVADAAGELAGTLEAFLRSHGFGIAFRDDYLLPMIGCIWSCSTAQMLQFPLGTLVRFCHNHGLLQVRDRPQWYTVRGGSREYVRKIARSLPDVRLATPALGVSRHAPGASLTLGAWVRTATGAERFDDVVLACHPPQALACLDDASPRERATLGAIRFQDNDAVLHTDAHLLPGRRKAWAAWNYERAAAVGPGPERVCLHYLINRLQPLPWTAPVIVSLNPLREPRAGTVLQRIRYAHPVLDLAALAAQAQLPGIQGRAGVWFCGAWTRHGFHEDGLQSGLQVADRILARTLPDVAALGADADDDLPLAEAA